MPIPGRRWHSGGWARDRARLAPVVVEHTPAAAAAAAAAAEADGADAAAAAAAAARVLLGGQPRLRQRAPGDQGRDGEPSDCLPDPRARLGRAHKALRPLEAGGDAPRQALMHLATFCPCPEGDSPSARSASTTRCSRAACPCSSRTTRCGRTTRRSAPGSGARARAAAAPGRGRRAPRARRARPSRGLVPGAFALRVDERDVVDGGLLAALRAPAAARPRVVARLQAAGRSPRGRTATTTAPAAPAAGSRATRSSRARSPTAARSARSSSSSRPRARRAVAGVRGDSRPHWYTSKQARRGAGAAQLARLRKAIAGASRLTRAGAPSSRRRPPRSRRASLPPARLSGNRKARLVAEDARLGRASQRVPPRPVAVSSTALPACSTAPARVPAEHPERGVATPRGNAGEGPYEHARGASDSGGATSARSACGAPRRAARRRRRAAVAEGASISRPRRAAAPATEGGLASLRSVATARRRHAHSNRSGPRVRDSAARAARRAAHVRAARNGSVARGAALGARAATPPAAARAEQMTTTSSPCQSTQSAAARSAPTRRPRRPLPFGDRGQPLKLNTYVVLRHGGSKSLVALEHAPN